MQHALSILAMFVGTGSLTNLDDLNIIRRIKSDKISDMTINVFFFFGRTAENGPPRRHVSNNQCISQFA